MAIDATKYPMLAKMESIQGESQIIGYFLEWLQEIGMTICDKTEYATMPWMPIRDNIETLLARHFEIDLAVVERERRQVLAEFQETVAAQAQAT